MELSPVGVPVHHTPGFNGVAGDQNQLVLLLGIPDQHSSTADQSNTASISASSPLFGASPAESQPDEGSSGAATSTVTVSVIVDEPGRRAKALKSLKESIPHVMKLQSLQDSDRQHQKDGSWHKKYVRRLSKELYQIVSWYAILQSALFAAVAQTSIFKCGDSWGPIGISVMVTLGTFKCAHDKLRRIGEEQNEVRNFQNRQNAVYDNIVLLLFHGSACDLDTLEPDSSQNSGVYSTRGQLVLGFLVGFAGLISFSCLCMLCGSPCKCSPH